MTYREIEAMKKTIPQWENGVPPVRTEEQVRVADELNCREMINTILVYWGPSALAKGSYCHENYLKHHEAVLGTDVVARLCGEQTEDFKKAVVMRDVYSNKSGAFYNSVVWADELVDKALEFFEYGLAAEGPENGGGYTLPDGKYHIFAYVDFIHEDRVIVLEPNKVVDGSHEPIGGDTYIVDFGDMAALREGLDWCLEQFSTDRYGINSVLLNAAQRSAEASRSDAGVRSQVLGVKEGIDK